MELSPEGGLKKTHVRTYVYICARLDSRIALYRVFRELKINEGTRLDGVCSFVIR